MHLERSVQLLLTEFIHIAHPYSLWGTSLAGSRPIREPSSRPFAANKQAH